MADSMTTTFLPREPATTFYVDDPDGTIGPVVGVVAHVALGYYPEGDVAVSRWDLAKWDVAGGGQWEGAAPLDDVSCDVLSVTLTEGRDRPLDRFRPGTATVVLNDPDGKYSPWQTAADASAFSAIRCGIDLVVWADVPATSQTFPRFRGIVEAIEDTFPDSGEGHTVTFHATDYLALLAAYDGVEQPAIGGGELTGARLARIAQNAGYVGPINFDVGTVAVQATTLARNALDESGIVVDTEVGAYWCDRNGVLQFRDRNGLILDAHYTDVQAVFGDVEAAGEICYLDLDLSSDTDKIENVVSISNAGGTAITRTDLTSISLYHPRTFQRFDLIHVDPAESVTIADRHLATYAYAANRIDALALDLLTMTDAQRATVLGLDTLHRIEVRRRPTGFQVVAALQIQGMTETISATQWRVTFRTFSAAAIFDVARWNADRWDVGLWGY